MAGEKDGWEIAHKFGDIIVLGGFVIDLAVRILQIRGIVALDPNREALIAGGCAASLGAAFFATTGCRKLYYSTASRRFHHPGWDLLVFTTLAALATFCFITSPTVAQHHRGATSAARTAVSAQVKRTAVSAQVK
jgi:hypothetical protein